MCSFVTPEQLVEEDIDSRNDVYERSGGVTQLVSIGPTGGSGDTNANLNGFSEDGSRVFFSTTEQLTADDMNVSQTDVYERSGGDTTLVSTGPVESHFPSFFNSSSDDGAYTTFTTRTAHAPEDTNGAGDGYVRHAGTTTLVTADSAGNAVSGDAIVSSDGALFMFRTTMPAVTEDTDARTDLYLRAAGTTTLISTGPSGGNGAFDVEFKGASDDLTHVFFTTSEGLVPEDTDGGLDIYEHTGGVTRLVSTGPSGNTVNAAFQGNSADGSRVFFSPAESLMPSDTDPGASAYERYQGATTHISDPLGSNLDGSGRDARLEGRQARLYADVRAPLAERHRRQPRRLRAPHRRSQPLSPRQGRDAAAFLPGSRLHGLHGAGSRARAAACLPLLLARAVVAVPHGGHPGRQRSAGESLRLDHRVKAQPGNPATPEDEADVRLRTRALDVRRTSDLADYTGELEIGVAVRITDRDGPTPAGGGPAPTTLPDLTLAAPVPCVETADPTIGSTCAVNTTMDAIAPGTVTEKHRTIWEIGHGVRVLDGGADGDVSTDDGDAPFLSPGLFLP